MKFILFLCLSLFASMFHAAAMPIRDIDSTPMSVEAPMANHMSDHCAKVMQENPNVNHCCFGVAIQSTATSPVVSLDPQRSYRSPFPSRVRHTSSFVFRPPKFRSV